MLPPLILFCGWPNPLYFIRGGMFFSTHSYKLFGTTGIARGIQITKKAKTYNPWPNLDLLIRIITNVKF
jgi:hypothetical protein